MNNEINIRLNPCKSTGRSADMTLNARGVTRIVHSRTCVTAECSAFNESVTLSLLSDRLCVRPHAFNARQLRHVIRCYGRDPTDSRPLNSRGVVIIVIMAFRGDTRCAFKLLSTAPRACTRRRVLHSHLAARSAGVLLNSTLTGPSSCARAKA